MNIMFESICKEEETRVGEASGESSSMEENFRTINAEESTVMLQNVQLHEENKLLRDKLKEMNVTKQKIYELERQLREVEHELAKREQSLKYQSLELRKAKEQNSLLNQEIVEIWKKNGMRQDTEELEKCHPLKQVYVIQTPVLRRMSEARSISPKKITKNDELHETSRNDEQSPDPFACDTCGISYVNASSLRSHRIHCLRRHSGGGASVAASAPPAKKKRASVPATPPATRRLTCAVCFKNFLRACGLSSHMRVHQK